jgi:hypothetical protein
LAGVKNYIKNTKTYDFDFTPNNERENYETLNLLIDKTFSGRGNVEKVEELFNITFASDMENGKPVYLNSNDEALFVKGIINSVTRNTLDVE